MQLRFFASIRERLDTDQEQLSLATEKTITARELLLLLQERGDKWRDALQDDRILIAVNQQLVSADTPLNDHDEVAFFPPVTGG